MKEVIDAYVNILKTAEREDYAKISEVAERSGTVKEYVIALEASLYSSKETVRILEKSISRLEKLYLNSN